VKLLGVLAVGLMLAGPLSAQDYGKGLAAYEAGNYYGALREFQPLAQVGLASAQYHLGLMYSIGQGVTQDYAEAAKWYRLAAERGNAAAQFTLGSSYDEGLGGVLQDYTEAAKWFSKAAEQGETRAQYRLGLMYELGNGVAQDDVIAYMWLNIGAANGNHLALESRRKIEKRMTREKVADAQRYARVCLTSNYQDCDNAAQPWWWPF
jgi:hypothetical protein